MTTKKSVTKDIRCSYAEISILELLQTLKLNPDELLQTLEP